MKIGMPTMSSRPLTLIYEIPISQTKKFWDGLKEGKIYASKCSKCGKVIFPPVADCSECLSSGLDWIELSEEGVVEAFTHIIVKPSSFKQEATYTVVIGRMIKEGIRVLTWLRESNLMDIKVNMKVKLVVKPNIDGEPTYMFIPG